MPRNQKRQLERLLLIQPRVTVRSIIQAQILLLEPLTPANALRDRIARQLEVHAAQVGVVFLVDLERAGELLEDGGEAAGFDFS